MMCVILLDFEELRQFASRGFSGSDALLGRAVGLVVGLCGLLIRFLK